MRNNNNKKIKHISFRLDVAGKSLKYKKLPDITTATASNFTSIYDTFDDQ